MNLFDKKFVHFMWDDSLDGKEGFVSDSIDTLVTRVNDDILMTVDEQRIFGLVSYGDSEHPFAVAHFHYRFFYSDPLYNVKLAWKQGKTIEFRNKGSANWIVTNSPNWLDRCEYRVKPEEQDNCLLILNDHNEVSIVKEGREWKALLIKKGTDEECKQYIKEHYCGRCAHQSCTIEAGTRFCKGFKELKESKQKRRKTNRELAKWIMQGNGQVKHRDGNALNTFNTYDVRDDDKPCPDEYVIRGWDETEWSEPLIEE